MPNSKRDRSFGEGVYFAHKDYVGISRRLAILVIDSLIIFVILNALSYITISILELNVQTFLQLSLVTVWLYIVVLKRSQFRTIGYRLVGAKLVNLQGKRPSLFMLTFRELLWILGPFNIIFDLLWCSMDIDSQSLRDRMSHLCVVKNTAEPIGTGEIHLTYHCTMGYSYSYPEVRKPKSASAEENAVNSEHSG